MKFYSTRDPQKRAEYSLKQAAFAGLAPDGGLFMPEVIPQVDLTEIQRLASLSYADMACYLAGLFFGADIPSEDLSKMVRRAYDFPCPLVKISDTLSVLELFHGPTFAFKDFGARFMGGMLGLLRESDEHLTVLTATSGDTGSAVAAGFLGVPGIDVVVLYPEGKVSPLQESQMTTLGGNIHPVCVRGNFDDCQALVKAVFNDSDFREEHNVTSANSINVLRWIPQSFYYFYAWAQWKTARDATGVDEAPVVAVPSGNYGNITAGMLAAAMGLPVKRFVAASNANSVIPEFLETGDYCPRPSVRTVANAMDVGAPSNYERMMCLYGSHANLVKTVTGYSYSDDEILAGISEIHSRCGFVSDPHAATGYLAARDAGLLASETAESGFYLATAHAAKFGDISRRALGFEPSLPAPLAAALARSRVFVTMDNDLAALETLVAKLD